MKFSRRKVEKIVEEELQNLFEQQDPRNCDLRGLTKDDFIDPKTGERIRYYPKPPPSAKRDALRESLKRLDTNYIEAPQRWAVLAGIK